MAALDFFSDPASQGILNLSAGLLQAGGPSFTPVSFGQAIGQGMQRGVSAYQSAQQAQAQNKLLDLHGKLYGSQATKLDAEAAKLQRLQQIISGNTTPGVSDASAMAVGAPWAAKTPMSPVDNFMHKATLLGQEGFLQEANQMADLVKKMRPELEFKDGVWYDKNSGAPVRGGVGINPQGMGYQMNVGPNGQVSVGSLEGSLPLYLSQLRTAEQAKAERAPFLGQTDPQGRPIAQTQEQFVQRVTGGGPQASGPTISQIAGQQTLGRGDAERVQGLEQKIPNLISTIRRLETMQKLTADDQTYAAAGAEIKASLGSFVQAFGLKVNETKTANTETYIAHVAELLKDRLASKDYGSGSGVSNLDILAASKPLPELAKTTQGRVQIMQAMTADANRSLNDAVAARDYYGSNQSLRGFRYPSETEKAPIPKEAPKKTEFVVNQVYTDAKGNKARYLGSGKWQEMK